MKDIAQQLRSLIERVEPQLSQMDRDDLQITPAPEEWSKKEILGHLIDSAANNHQRIVRAVYNAAVNFPTYDQIEWVRIQRHNERPWSSLVELWFAYTKHLCHIIESIPKDAESARCNIGKEEPVPLEFVVRDYISHLQLHLKDVLGKKL